MYISEDFRVKIYVKLEVGMWIFETKSATGKTRLFNELRMRNQITGNIGVYTYDKSDLNFQYLKNILKNDNIDIILLDRYDMYNACSDEIRDASKKKIILVSAKVHFPKACKFRLCKITQNVDCIEVVPLCQ